MSNLPAPSLTFWRDDGPPIWKTHPDNPVTELREQEESAITSMFNDIWDASSLLRSIASSVLSVHGGIRFGGNPEFVADALPAGPAQDAAVRVNLDKTYFYFDNLGVLHQSDFRVVIAHELSHLAGYQDPVGYRGEDGGATDALLNHPDYNYGSPNMDVEHQISASLGVAARGCLHLA